MKKKKKIFVWQINERKYSATGLCSTISYLISVAKNILICQKYQVFFNQIWRVSHWVEHRNLVSVSGWQLRLLKHCWSRDINSNISLALCLQPRRDRRGLTDSMKASPPAGLQQVHQAAPAVVAGTGHLRTTLHANYPGWRTAWAYRRQGTAPRLHRLGWDCRRTTSTWGMIDSGLLLPLDLSALFDINSILFSVFH